MVEAPDFEIVFELAEHFREIDASVFAEGRRLGGGVARWE